MRTRTDPTPPAGRGWTRLAERLVLLGLTGVALYVVLSLGRAALAPRVIVEGVVFLSVDGHQGECFAFGGGRRLTIEAETSAPITLAVVENRPETTLIETVTGAPVSPASRAALRRNAVQGAYAPEHRAGALALTVAADQEVCVYYVSNGPVTQVDRRVSARADLF